MHRVLLLLSCCAVMAGCGGKRSPATASPQPGKTSGNATAPIVTRGGSLPGKVVSFNSNGRFAVLRFPLGQMPALEQRMGIFRDGLKVGEVKISGPQRDTHTVADLLAGECRVGDEVRSE